MNKHLHQHPLIPTYLKFINFAKVIHWFGFGLIFGENGIVQNVGFYGYNL